MNKLYKLKSMGREVNHTASISQFLSLINSAEYIISNSFHGVAFSIIMQKQFFAVGMKDKADRVKSLLSLAGLENRYIESDNLEFADIEYGIVNERLKNNIQTSKLFIMQSLELSHES